MWAGSIAALLAVAPLVAQKPEAAETLLQTAIKKEVVDGNLTGAIEGYKKTVAAAKDNRAIAAQALVHMADCYQKLGDAEARKIWERLVREFADQREAVAMARARLGAGAPNSGLTTRQMWTGPKVDAYGSVSPDGRFLSFTDWDTGDLALHDFVTHEDRHLTSKGTWADSGWQAIQSVISRDGKQIAFEWHDGISAFEVRLIDLNGGNARVLVSNGEEVFPEDWSPDGKWIAAQRGRAQERKWDLVLVSTADGSLRVLKSYERDQPGGKVVFSPDGKYLAHDGGPENKLELRLLAIDGGSETSVLNESASNRVLGWSPDGKKLLFASDRSGLSGIWAIAISEGKALGAPELLKANVHPVPLGMTRSGALFYSAVASGRDVFIASVDYETGKMLSAPIPVAQPYLGLHDFPQWSRDGKHLAYLSKRDADTRSSRLDILAIRSTETGQVRELHPDLRMLNNGTASQPLWSPDGGFVLVNGVDKGGRSGVFRIDTQTGDAAPFVLGDAGRHEVYARAWSADGQTLYLVRSDVQSKVENLVAHDTQSGQERELLHREAPRGHLALGWVALSPDERRLTVPAFDRSSQTGSLLVVPVDGAAPRELLRTSNSGPEQLGFFAAWSPDGRYVIFRKGGPATRETFRIPAQGGTPIRFGAEWTPGPSSINPDGRHVAFANGEHAIEIWAMENFLPSPAAKK
jgi:Tol biopolymer transport system component